MRWNAWLVLVAALATLVAPAAAPPASAAEDSLAVAVSASIEAPVRAAARLFEERTGVRVRVQTHLDGRIATDLRGRAGDPDLVVASEAAVARLMEARALAPPTAQRFLETDVVLFGAADALRYLGSLADIELPSEPAASAAPIALPDSLDPAFDVARRLLQSAGVWRELKAGALIVSDSRAALAAVETGAAAFAFAPRAASRNSTHVRIVWSPEDPSAARLGYSIAIFLRSQRRPEAAELYRFLLSPSARRLYEAHGFDLSS